MKLKRVCAILLSIVLFFECFITFGDKVAYAAEYVVYSVDANICDYISGEGTYFDANRKFYRDSNDKIAYCLQAGMLGASSSGSTGYVYDEVYCKNNMVLLNKLKNILSRSYPIMYGEYVVEGDSVSGKKEKGLLIDDVVYECTENEARAVTAFVLHKTIIDYNNATSQDNLGITINNYKNGASAKNDLVSIIDALLAKVDVSFGLQNIEYCWGNFDENDIFIPSEELIYNESENVFEACCKIVTDRCYIENVSIDNTVSGMDGAFIEKIEYKNVDELYVYVKAPYNDVNRDGIIQIDCTAKTYLDEYTFLTHESLQDIVVLPYEKNINFVVAVQAGSGEGRIYKLDRETKEPIGGVCFSVCVDRKCEDEIIEVVTGDDGYANIGALSAGKYYVKEKSCPACYRLDDQIYEIEIIPGKENCITIFNDRVGLQIELQKLDAENNGKCQGDAVFSGAVYGVYSAEDLYMFDDEMYDTDELVDKIVLDDRGFGKSTVLYPGKYYVQEISPPLGYKINDEKYYVDCRLPEKQDFDKNGIVLKKIKVKDYIKKQKFQLYKYYNKDDEMKELCGAGFSAWLISELDKDKTGKYIFDRKKCVVIGENNDKEIFTDKNGYVCSVDLPYGEYVVKETTVPEGFLPVDDFVVKIDDDIEETQELLMIKDEKIKRRLKIVKCDSTTRERVKEEGFGFRIYDKNNKNYIKQFDSEIEEFSDVFYTNSDGVIALQDGLEYGKYVIEEVCVPEKSEYLINKDKVEIDIKDDTVCKDEDGESIVEIYFYDEKAKGKVNIKKAFENNINSINRGSKAAVFGVYSADDNNYYKKNEKVGQINVDSTGEGWLDNIPLGKYYLQEEKTSNGYILDKKIYEFTISKDEKSEKVVPVNLFVENKLTKVRFIKKDKNTGNAIAGATMLLLDENDKVVDTWISRNEWHEVTGLKEHATYRLVEEFAPYGYLKAKDISFKVENAEGNECQSIVMKDSTPVGRIRIKKHGDKLVVADSMDDNVLKYSYEDGELSGVLFDLWAAEKITANDVFEEVIYPKGACIAVGETDDNGEIVFDNLPVGKYLIYERMSDKEHVNDMEPIEVQVCYVDQYTAKIDVNRNVANMRIETKINVHKMDAETNQSLSGAEISLFAGEDIYDSVGKLVFLKDSVVDKKITDEDGFVYFHNSLVPGYYYVRETKEPEGYLINEDAQGIIIGASEDTIIDLSIYDYMLKATISDAKISIKGKGKNETTTELTTEETSENVETVVSTGDSFDLIMICSIMLFSAITLVICIKKSKRNN